MSWDNYPRPQFKRKQWQNLNGSWQMNGREVYVPSCQFEEKLEYTRSFVFEKVNSKVLLHFGAADQIAEVYLNGRKLGSHEGGYLPFTFDVTDALLEGENELRVLVVDELDRDYPYGKQRKDHGGMWYTPMAGLWGSVWLEQVPQNYIEAIEITPDLNGISVAVNGPECEILLSNGQIAATKSGKVRIEIENPVLWTPDNPHLYTAVFKGGGDEVEVYFALRTIEVKNIKGINRVCLNGRPVFIHGVLDQGYFSPGLMLPDDPAEYERDVLRMKELGFNTIRKHIKIEPEEFYHACDRLGMLVIQDLVNSGGYKFFKDTILGTIGARLGDRTGLDGKRKQFWIEHSKETLKHLYNHPSLVIYTIFNEGWGQFESDAVYSMLKSQDGTRLYDSTSGWFAQKLNDFDSRHIYFRTVKLHPKTRPLFVSECGGYSLDVNGYSGNAYGYGKCSDTGELTDKIVSMYEKMILPAIKGGCCGCIYTQLSDVEDEINGFYSFDREKCKVDKERIQELSASIYDEINKT